MEINVSREAAAEIRSIMARKSLKQSDLAAALGLSQQCVSSRLTGQTPVTVNELVAIGRWLGVDAPEILARVLGEQRGAA